MDFTTFLTFSIQNTLRYGGKIEPYYEISDAYNDKLNWALQSFDAGVIEGSKIFSTKKEVSDYLDSL